MCINGEGQFELFITYLSFCFYLQANLLICEFSAFILEVNCSSENFKYACSQATASSISKHMTFHTFTSILLYAFRFLFLFALHYKNVFMQSKSKSKSRNSSAWNVYNLSKILYRKRAFICFESQTHKSNQFW